MLFMLYFITYSFTWNWNNMQQLSKIVTRQDANFKLSPSASNETSINLSKEISALISDESGDATFTLYKSDFIKALSALCLIPKNT